MKNIYERYIGQWKKSESSHTNRVFGQIVDLFHCFDRFSRRGHRPFREVTVPEDGHIPEGVQSERLFISAN